MRDEDGCITGLCGVSRDVTERKKTEEALRESEARYRTYVDHSPVAIFIADEQARYLDANDAACQMSGYTREELLTLRINDLDASENNISAATSIDDLKIKGVFRGEQCMRRKDGSIGYVNTDAVAISKNRYMAFCSDISLQRKLQAQLQQAQKMEAIGQLAGGVAHDFNNLLQVINGHIEFVLQELPTEAPVRQDIEQVAMAGEKAARLVGQLLAFSRRQVMKPENLDLNEAIENIMKMLRRVIGEHIQLDFVAGHELGTIHGDRGMIEQIIMNLCVNSRDAMPNGGCIIIETENVLIDRGYCETHAWAIAGRYVLLSVTDSGCGMDRETLEHIFEPFFSTKEEGKGTGLGLATVYGIVKQHGGMIQAYSETGKGTTFKIYLPLCERPARTVGTKVEGSVRGGEETILLAEDDGMVRHLSKMILEMAGYTVMAAADGEEAWALFRQHGDHIHLLLLDVVMPHLGGHEVYERAREIRPDIRTLFASGYSENAVHTNFILHKDLSLIQKPFARETLLRMVRDILDR